MRDLVDTTEMYLRTIYELEEEGIPPLRARIAERLDQSGPTVSQTVARMERDGLLSISKDRSLKLSAEGRELATAVMRKHRLAERLLTDVIGLPWEKVHDEACRWEHVMGDDVERRLVDVLKERTTSPFGNPIPGLDVLLDDAPDEHRTELLNEAEENHHPDAQRAADLNATKPVEVIVASINEIVQVEHKIMAKLSVLSMGPGSTVTLVNTEDGIRLSNDNGYIDLPDELSHAIQVKAVK
ncbi:metal-dependent transcriptional regulator [Corynebacterium sp. 320]|uniref:Diphtheria toxin repressor n=1 Tax=Corynebacterium zhongnanshanii TaxID=2768834 RepID=A0ABQ6VHY3_9CORY|nr:MULTISPECIES: metal-dependent transcriptional regulator [Corynebacterium]KAB1503751.1 metal-dependent transcriptional regulator [Corynebacterium sp. 320]KAB1553149.1 metal-dependent transcriptional regulator [Corynebacterium sp. 321]KAB1553633.1 metal-dependent transcriptional regulator [Corynebacterium sp. 319]KAB3523398.1 metal-dependent transcriptional regulator [Corynebacterium zhongnanshanii]KAB3527887.1 metal-dependent transcriptional regulator [Corynebacterium sp. 250]